MNDNYIYEIEQALTRLLEFFEPEEAEGFRYVVWEDGEPLARVGGELADAIDHANEIMYGEGIEFDED